MDKKIGIALVPNERATPNKRLEIKFTKEELAEINKIDDDIQSILDVMDFKPNRNGEIEPFSEEQAAEIYKLNDRRTAIMNQVIQRVVDRYNGEMQAFYKDIEAYIIAIAKTYDNIPWEIVSKYPTTESPKDVIENGIWAFISTYQDYISKYDEAAYNQISAFIEEISIKSSKPALGKIHAIIPELEKDTLLNINTKAPATYKKLIDKITKTAFRTGLDESVKGLKIEKTGAPQISSYAKIIYGELDGVKVKLTPFDKSVLDALVTYFDMNQNYVSLPMINSAINGKSESGMSEARAKEIIASMEKFATSLIEIDAAEEIQLGNYEILNDGKIGGNLLSMEYVKGKLNGNTTAFYKIISMPLYQYAKAKKQIGACPPEVLRIPIKLSADGIAIRDALLEWIMELTNPYSSQKNPELTYDKLFNWAHIGQGLDPVKEKMRARKYVERILEHWKKIGYIQDYMTDIKQGRKIYKLKVMVEQKPKLGAAKK